MAHGITRIGLLDHLGHGNLGDEATLTAFMQNIKTRWPDAAFVGLSLNPFDTRQRHGIPSYAIRSDSKLPPEASGASLGVTVPNKSGFKTRLGKYPNVLRVLRALNTLLVRFPKATLKEGLFLVESFRIARKLDLLVVCGGGQLLDSWGGPWAFPYTIFKWVLLSRLAGVKCYVMNVGAGPINHSFSKYFFKRALQLSSYVSFRDEDSRQLVRTIGFKGNTETLADSVYSLDTSKFRAAPGGADGSAVIGICPMVYCDPRVYWEKDQKTYDSLIGKLGALGSWLLGQNHRLSIFSSDIRIDQRAIDDLMTELLKTTGNAPRDRDRIARNAVQSTEDLLSAMASTDYIVTCRFHGVVFAQLLNKPVVALSHHPKVTTLMRDLGLSEYCLDIRTSDIDELKTTLGRLMANKNDVKERMSALAGQYKSSLAQQFDHLFPKVNHHGQMEPSSLQPVGVGEAAR